MTTYYSQDQQDKFLHERVFGDYKNGFFVDVGAHNGVKFSNTLFFENTYGWTGINIEPSPFVFKELQKNRPKCINLNCAIDAKNGNAPFYCNSGATEMLSGLVEHFDPRHKSRLDQENKVDGGQTEVVSIPTRTLQTVFDEYNVTHVQFLSIDVEGGEKAVVKSIDFDKVFIDVIVFEDNYRDGATREVREFLESKGFKVIHERQDIFMLNKYSAFRLL